MQIAETGFTDSGYTHDDDIQRENRKKGRELFAEVEPKRYIRECFAGLAQLARAVDL